MTMFIQRQFSGFMVNGVVTDPAAVYPPLWQLTDVPPKYILKIADGKYLHDTIQVTASGGTETVPLPNTYPATTGVRLVVVLNTDQTIKAVTVSPDHPTSTVLVKAGANQRGVLSFVSSVTSITLTNPQTTIANVEYFIFELPELDLNTSWRIGSQATGVV